jgi:hypothetical protein
MVPSKSLPIVVIPGRKIVGIQNLSVKEVIVLYYRGRLTVLFNPYAVFLTPWKNGTTTCF